MKDHKLVVAPVAVLCVLVGVFAFSSSAVAAAETCPNEQLRAENGSTQLPECRAYEQVTPAGPYSAEFNALSPDGQTLFFASGGSAGGLPSEVSSGRSAVRMFGVTRQADSWSFTLATNFSDELTHMYPFVGATEDGMQIFLISETLESEAIPNDSLTQAFSTNLYSVEAAGSPVLISHDAQGAPLSGGESQGLTGPVIVSADGSHVVFSSGTPLTATAAASGGGPYIYEADAAGTVELVSVMSDGQVPTPEGGAALGDTNVGDRNSSNIGGIATNAISEDGSTVFFNSTERYDPFAPVGLGRQVFMHREGRTVDVSPGIEDASFDAASRDGSKVVLSGADGNIYEFDVSTGTLSTIAGGGETAVNTYLAMSADGSHVYFASDLRDSPTAPPYEGDPFLYESVGGEVTYIATLTEHDVKRLTTITPPASSLSGNEGGEGQADQTGTGARGPIRATADGAHLVFESEQQLTPDDHNEEELRTNVYEYTDGRGLTRVSAGSLAGSGNGPYSATIGSQQQAPDFAARGSGEEPPFTFGPEQMDGRVVTEDGAVFFSSREALAAGAANGPLHVYEWNEGRTTLISASGAEASDARYLESSADGDDVYFATAQPLLPSDTDPGWVSIWDAAVNGGFPSVVQLSACSANNECPAPPLPGRETSPSVGFSGPGNASPREAASVASVPAPKPLTRAQKLAQALKACRIDKRQRRITCEKKARNKFGTDRRMAQ